MKARIRVGLSGLMALAAAACGGSPDAGSPDGGSLDSGQEAAQDSGGPSDASTDSTPTDAPSPAPEPGYLRNDAYAGFAYTSDFGSPYDSILGAPLNTTQSAIAPGFKTTPGAGQIMSSESFRLIASSADLYSALDISASLSVSSGLANVNAKTSFAKSQTIDSTDLWVLADFIQVGATQKIVNPTLTPQAAALSPTEFYALYGDRYAAEIVTGAEMFCTVQIHTFSQQDKSQLTASLGFSYGQSSASGSFSQSATSATSGRTTVVNCQYLGFAPKTVVTDLPSLLAAGTAFQTGSAANLGNVTTSTLYLDYTSYYGIPGYPGVPDGTAAKVAQQSQLASDYLLYDSLVSNDFSAYYADSTYASLPFFTHMKAYRDALSTFLDASVINSQDPGVPVPSSMPDGVITNWLTTTTLSSQAGSVPQYTVYGIKNGVVPKRISDYSIPLRYAYPDKSGDGVLNGVSFSPVSAVPPVASVNSTAPVDYQLYLINKPGSGGGLWLEYQWDTGTYFFPHVTNASGAPDAAMITSAIDGFALSSQASGAEYVIVSKANGLVLTDNIGATGTSNPQMAALHFVPSTTNASINTSQLWEFYVDAGSIVQNCQTYVAPTASPGVSCANGNNGPVDVSSPPCGSLLYGISRSALDAHRSGYWSVNGSSAAGTAIDSNGGGGCQDCTWGCGATWCQYTSCGGGPDPWDDFFLQPHDNGGSQAIYNYAGSAGGAVSYMVTNANQTASNLPSPTIGENIEVGSNDGYSNELWAFIPSTNIDTSP